jgi:hypothetical protein
MALFETIAEFTLQADLIVVRARLESEGIRSHTQDELTVQVDNFLSGAIGGIKLQTLSEDATRGRELLKEWGYLHESTEVVAPWWGELDKWSRKLPLFGRIDLFIARLLAMSAIAVSVIAVLLWWVFSPSLKEQLTRGTWCVDQVVHNGQPLTANSTVESATPQLVLMIDGCSETLRFWPTEEVNVPGFDTPAQFGKWTLDGSHLTFQGLKDERGIFSGTFTVEMDRGYLSLRSSSTVIRCSSLWIGL